MKPQNDFKALFMIIFALLIFIACGGGGGSSGGSGDDVVDLQYVGSTNPVVITPANATRLAASVFGTDNLTGQFPTAASDPSTADTVGMLPLMRALQALPRSTPKIRNVTSIVSPLAAIRLDETEQCYPNGSTEPSGYYTLTGTLDDKDGTGTLILTYTTCQDGDTFMDGTMSWEIDKASFAHDTWIPVDSTFTFNAFTMIAPGMNVLLSGTMRDQINDDGSETLTLNIVMKDNDTQGMQKAENVVILSTYVNGYFVSQTITGRFYDSAEGYLDIKTPQALLYDEYDSQYPSNGQLLFRGADSAHLRVTALSEAMALIELDLNNDAVYETIGEIPWEVLTIAGTNPLDVDGDGLLDSWETTHSLSSVTYADASEDGDGDALNNYEEYLLGTNPASSDSDNDNMQDGWEVTYGFNPISDTDAALDFDGDGATNFQEYTYSTDPTDNTSYPPADLSISKSVTLTTVSTQTLFGYTLSVSNLGPGPGHLVKLTDNIPEGSEIYTVVPGMLSAPWDCVIGTDSLTCEARSPSIFAAGEEITLFVPMIAPSATGDITNSAMIESTTTDFVGANNTATVETTVADSVLTLVDVVIDDENGVDGLDWPSKLEVSPDGKHLYVTSIYDDAVTVFARDFISGTLTFVEAQRDGIDTPDWPDHPKDVAVSPDGKHIYVTTEWSNGEWIGSVVAYNRNSDTGALTYLAKYRDGVDGIDGIAQAIAVCVSGDGKNVYVAGPNDDAVAVFNRDTSTGLLAFSTAIVDGVDGIDGLAGAFDVALSPDDAYLYVAGNAIAVFSRDSEGILSYVSVMTSEEFNPGSIAVSGDGKHLYSKSRGIWAFVRNIDNGELTHLSTYTNGENGIFGLEGMKDLSIAPDGKYIYVPATYDNSLGVFARDSDTGTLRFIEVQKDGIGNVEGLGVAWAVAVSPDSAFVYVSACSDDTLNAFSVDLNAER